MSSPDTSGMRISHADREAAVRRLGEHFSEGRLSPEEYEERVSTAYGARTNADLVPLFTDLPQHAPPPALPTTHLPAPAPFPPPAPVAPADALAPYGREPHTGLPYSDRQQVVAGVLQLVIPLGVGRFYSGHTGIAVAQLALSFIGIGVIWAFIDGILILVGRPTDPEGRPLRPGTS